MKNISALNVEETKSVVGGSLKEVRRTLPVVGFFEKLEVAVERLGFFGNGNSVKRKQQLANAAPAAAAAADAQH